MLEAENADSTEGRRRRRRKKNRAWVWTKLKKIHPRDVTTECQRWQEGAALWINHAASACLTAPVAVTSKKGAAVIKRGL